MSVLTLDDLIQKGMEHEQKDAERFAEMDAKIRELPDEIKKSLNGSVAQTVELKMGQFKWDLFKWFGMGGLVILMGIAVAWGTLTERVGNQENSLKEIKADIKTLIQRP